MLQTKTCIYIADLYCCLYYYYPTCSSAKRWEFSTLSDYSASGVKRVLWQLSSADICGNLQHVVGPKHAVCDTDIRVLAVLQSALKQAITLSAIRIHVSLTLTWLTCQTLSIGRALIRKWDARDTAIETAVWQLQPKGVQTVQQHFSYDSMCHLASVVGVGTWSGPLTPQRKWKKTFVTVVEMF